MIPNTGNRIPDSLRRFAPGYSSSSDRPIRFPVSAIRYSNSAFTLIEVLVALAVFALAAVMLGAAYVNVLNGYAVIGRSHDSDEDVKFACAQLLAEPDLQTAKNGDQFDCTGGRHATWSSEIAPTTMPDLFTVTFHCEITEPGQSESKKVTQVFTLMRPTWSDPADRTKLLQDAKDRIADLQGKKS